MRPPSSLKRWPMLRIITIRALGNSWWPITINDLRKAMKVDQILLEYIKL